MSAVETEIPQQNYKPLKWKRYFDDIFSLWRTERKEIDEFIALANRHHNGLLGHFTVMDGSVTDGDLVLVQTFLLYYVNQVILMLTSIFQGQFP